MGELLEEMSNFTLSQLVSGFISNWEGHTQSEGDYYIRLRDKVKDATLDEINTQYNSLTQQQLWVVPVIDIFYDEILNRIFNDTTYAISTTWTSINQWLSQPFVIIRVGFEDFYPVADINSSGIILGNTPQMNGILLTQNELARINLEIIRIFLDPPVTVVLEVNHDQIQIVGFENSRSQVRIPQVNSMGGNIIRVSAQIECTNEWRLVQQMYQGLRTSKPTIIDPFSDRLINQLMDVTELEDIINEDGIAVAEDTVVEIDQEEEDED